MTTLTLTLLPEPSQKDLTDTTLMTTLTLTLIPELNKKDLSLLHNPNENPDPNHNLSSVKRISLLHNPHDNPDPNPNP